MATAFAQKAQNSKALANQQREAKNLLGVFPFSNGDHHGHHADHGDHGDHHGDHHGHGLALPRRSQAAPRRRYGFKIQGYPYQIVIFKMISYDFIY